MAILRTSRLVLRPLAETDAEDLHAAFGDAEAMAYWSTPPHADLADTLGWLRRAIETPAEAGEEFAVAFGGQVIGKVGLWRFPEIGYILRRDAWGRGFAHEAVRAVLDRAFDVHRLEAVQADVDPRNVRSLALLSRLGFEETGRARGTVRVAGTWCDSVYLRLPAEAWRRGGRAAEGS